ncbi:ammonium transporter [Streptococcus agalactiae]|uniref:ammonium transporter n=1 Tax=Streptococcus agalactiae TaxID=1311 RepID=UPI000AEA4635|nr:ammonium transporter [Streptococcus agalactiae]
MFLLLCILSMWLMIFGVAFYYFGSLHQSLTSRIIYQFVLTVLITTIAWFMGAYFLGFEGHFKTVFQFQEADGKQIVNCLFQLCFALYAVVMLIGSIIDRVQTKRLLLAVVSWLLLVYTPLAYLIWNSEGVFAKMGVLDFSGGMVVHLSAGLSSYILAHVIGKSEHQHNKIKNDNLFLGMILITFGWFGFNMGPVGEWNSQAIMILLNTIFAIIGGGLAWTLAAKWNGEEEKTGSLLNGIIVGLVTSTAGVGYLLTWQLLAVTFFASLFTYFVTDYVAKAFAIDDVVSSFGMNGIGGLLGSLGVGLFKLSHMPVQLLALATTILLSIIMTYIISKAIFRK